MRAQKKVLQWLKRKALTAATCHTVFCAWQHIKLQTLERVSRVTELTCGPAVHVAADFQIVAVRERLPAATIHSSGSPRAAGRTCDVVCAVTRMAVLRMVLSSTVAGGHGRHILDARAPRAYMYAWCKADMHVTLCDEDTGCEEGLRRRGKLIQARHGTRRASFAWQHEHTGDVLHLPHVL